MKRYALSLIAVLLLVGSVYGHEKPEFGVGNHITSEVDNSPRFVVPEQEMTVDGEPVQLGELVSVRISKITQRPKYHVSCSYEWLLIDLSTGKTIRGMVTEQGTFFGAGLHQKTVKAVCAVTHVYIVRGEGPKVVEEVATKTVMLTSDINIGGEPLPPGPNPPTPVPPGPTPNPTPDLPDGKYGLAKSVYSLVSSHAPAASRTQGAKALAESMQGIAAAIAAGTKKDPQEILRDTTASNRSALTNAGISPESWQPVFVKLQDILFGLYETEGLNSVGDYQAAWNEIADGLNAIQ